MSMHNHNQRVAADSTAISAPVGSSAQPATTAQGQGQAQGSLATRRAAGRLGGRPVQSAAYPKINRTVLARKCGVHLGHVCKILSGRVGVSVDLARKMSSAIGVGLEEFLLVVEGQRHKQKKKRKTGLGKTKPGLGKKN